MGYTSIIDFLRYIAIIISCQYTTVLFGQHDTMYYFNFESIHSKLDPDNNNKIIENNNGVFKDIEPYLSSGGTVSNASPYRYSNIDYGNFNVGNNFIYHSPTWFMTKYTGISYNHIELKLNNPLIKDKVYKLSFLIGNFKSHKFKPSHYGIKFSDTKIIKQHAGSLLSNPDIFFKFDNDQEMVIIQSVFTFNHDVQYIYFGCFREDSFIIPKKFTPIERDIKFITENGIQVSDSSLTRVIIDNILIEELHKEPFPVKDIYFDPNSYEVLNSQDKKTIHDIAKYMNSMGNLDILIQGFTDRMGSFEYNQELSEKRASIIKKMLIEYGVPEVKILTLGRGEEIANDVNNDKYARKVSFLLFR